MFDRYILPVLIVVAGLIVYNMIAKKLLKLDTFDDSYEVTPDGRVVNMAA